MKNLNNIKLADLLPEKLANDSNVKSASTAIDQQLQPLDDSLDFPLILERIDGLTSEQWDHLAVQFDSSFWSTAWPVETKRSVLKATIPDKRKKGTLGAVKRAVAALGDTVTVSEWWQWSPQGTPHTFRVDVLQDEEATPIDTLQDVKAGIDDAKPLRSHYVLSVEQDNKANLSMCGVSRQVSFARVRSAGTVSERASGTVGMGAKLRGITSRGLLFFSTVGAKEFEGMPLVPVPGGKVGISLDGYGTEYLADGFVIVRGQRMAVNTKGTISENGTLSAVRMTMPISTFGTVIPDGFVSLVDPGPAILGTELLLDNWYAYRGTYEAYSGSSAASISLSSIDTTKGFGVEIDGMRYYSDEWDTAAPCDVLCASNGFPNSTWTIETERLHCCAGGVQLLATSSTRAYIFCPDSMVNKRIKVWYNAVQDIPTTDQVYGGIVGGLEFKTDKVGGFVDGINLLMED